MASIVFLAYVFLNVGILGRSERRVTFEAVVVLALTCFAPAVAPRSSAKRTTEDSSGAPLFLRIFAAVVDWGVSVVPLAALLGASYVWHPFALSRFGSVACVLGSTFVLIIYKLACVVIGIPTFGMWLFDLTIVSFDGATPSRERLMGRVILSLLSGFSGGVGVLWALVDEEGLTFHDHSSGTAVTRREDRQKVKQRTCFELTPPENDKPFPRHLLPTSKHVNDQNMGVHDPDQLELFPDGNYAIVTIKTIKQLASSRLLKPRPLKSRRRASGR